MRRFIPVFVFLAIAALLIPIEVRPAFPDPDSFYHAKMAMMIRDVGFIKQFPWLSDTVLAQNFVDHHLLYHVFLIPFVTFFDPMVGMKVAAALFGLIVFFALYRLLKALKAPYPEWLTLAAALSSSFLYRMSLPRAPSLSIALLLAAVWALIARRPKWIFVLSAVYVWFYYGWLLLFPTFLAIFVGQIVAERLHEAKEPSLWQCLKQAVRTEGKSFLLMLGGIAFGLVVNPYFPNNIYSDLHDVITFGLVNYQSVVAVGQEWYPMSPIDLVKASAVIVIILLLAIALLFPAAARDRQRISREHLHRAFSAIFLAAGFFAMTMKSSRYVEYAIPFLVVAAGVLLSFSLPLLKKEVFPGIQKWLEEHPLFFGLFIGLLCLSGASIAFAEMKNDIGTSEYFQAKQYQPAVDWIKTNVPAGDVVFHNAWDFSLVLFYLDDSHRYLVGLDPTYLYQFNPALYKEWSALVNGNDTDVEKIITDFHSRTVVVDKRFKNSFASNLEASGLFKNVEENTWVTVYEAN